MGQFADFVAASGAARVGVVRSAKEKKKYNPAQDYWKGLREAIFRGVEHGSLDDEIRQACDRASASKKANYLACGDAFTAWAADHRLRRAVVPSEPIRIGGLTIRMSPVMHVDLNGEPWTVRLHLNKGELVRREVESLLALMRLAFGDRKVGVLDVRRDALTELVDISANERLLIQGEAAAFVAMWEAIS